jgi:hypothetical protein
VQQVSLVRHPVSPPGAVRDITVDVDERDDDLLVLTYRLEGDMSRIRIPPKRQPHYINRLWNHTCFEAFVKHPASGAYREFNFSPSTEWAIFDFTSYREGMTPIDNEYRPAILTRRATRSFELEAPIRATSPSHLALAVIIEQDNGKLSYWALEHPDGKPDFHHPGGFTFVL